MPTSYGFCLIPSNICGALIAWRLQNRWNDSIDVVELIAHSVRRPLQVRRHDIATPCRVSAECDTICLVIERRVETPMTTHAMCGYSLPSPGFVRTFTSQLLRDRKSRCRFVRCV